MAELGISIEELLETAQKDATIADAQRAAKAKTEDDNDKPSGQNDVRGRDSDGPRSRRAEATDRDEAKDGSDHGSANGSVRSRRRSPEDRRRSSRDRRGGDFYRGPGRNRSRSPPGGDDRHYRPSDRSRRDDDRRRRGGDRERDRPSPRDMDRRERDRDSYRGPRGRNNSQTRAKSPEPTDDERDRRTVFVQQLAARLRTRELENFFAKVGPVKEAQIVKDRVSGRSKG